jgi:CRISPR/Cas system CMR subunit Cmr6 (Cas7 group RAMP superfamily)
MIQLKTIGFFSFKTKKTYKTTRARKSAEKTFIDKMNTKISKVIEIAKREIASYKQHIKELIRTVAPSFKRWSEMMAVNGLINEVKREIPKIYRIQL